METYLHLIEKRENHPLSTSKSWYLPNRVGYLRSISDIFGENMKVTKINNISVNKKTDKNMKKLFPHQQFIRDYMQEESPYRGVLLFHGLGVGKTCASIGASELLMNKRQAIVLSPASLETNYIEQVMECGHKYYTHNAYWRFLSNTTDTYKKYIFHIIDPKVLKKNKGIWYADFEKDTNFEDLKSTEKDQIKRQIESIIKKRYSFMHYDGITKTDIDKKTEKGTKNIFEGTVVIIDEVHNFVSRVISGTSYIANTIYKLLVSAMDIKIIALSGTPIINRPYELSILINLLKKGITTHVFKVKNPEPEIIQNMNLILEKSPYIDTFNYDIIKETLNIQLLPLKYEKNDIDKGTIRYIDNYKHHETQIQYITKTLLENKVYVEFEDKKIEPILPLNEEEFTMLFVDTQDYTIKNTDVLARRVMGCVSFFENDNSEAFPRVVHKNIIKLPLSKEQFSKYFDARVMEIKREKNAIRISKIFNDSVNQIYKTYTRSLCNFTLPGSMKRPYGGDIRILLQEMDSIDDYNRTMQNEVINQLEESKELKPITDKEIKVEQNKMIQQIIDELVEKNYLKFGELKRWSPKFEKCIKNIHNAEGPVLVYTQFRILEGVALFAKALEVNGYSEFKLIKTVDGLAVKTQDASKPQFAIYGGDESDMKELRTIYNNRINDVSNNTYTSIQETFKKTTNLHGEIIKILIITKSGSEGINLRNVRQVHILEPYWNRVRIEQVIGRAVRNGSHEDLPLKEREVVVYEYMCVFSKEQLEDRRVRIMDKGETTDEVINRIATRKSNVINSILDIMKSVAVDCYMHKHPTVKCYNFPIEYDDSTVIIPSNIYDYEENKIMEQKLNIHFVKINSKMYAMIFNIKPDPSDESTYQGQLFDYNEYVNYGSLKFVGLLEMENGKFIFKRVKKIQI